MTIVGGQHKIVECNALNPNAKRFRLMRVQEAVQYWNCRVTGKTNLDEFGSSLSIIILNFPNLMKEMKCQLSLFSFLLIIPIHLSFLYSNALPLVCAHNVWMKFFFHRKKN